MSERSYLPMDPSRMQELLRRRLTRRGLLKGAGAGVAGMSLSALLAACGEETTGGNGGSAKIDPSTIYDGNPEEG